MNDDPLTLCPECGENSLKKKVSAAGFRLSGSGWYETDFKSGKKKNLSEAPQASKSPASSSGHSCGSSGCGSCS